MKQLEDFLGPLLDRMRHSAVWFFGTMLVTVAVPAYIGLTISSAWRLPASAPGIIGLFAGAFLFFGLMVLLAHRTKRRLDSDAGSLTAQFARLDQATLRFVELALDVQLVYIEAIIEVLKSEIPEKATELDQAVRELREQKAQFLADARRRPPNGD